MSQQVEARLANLARPAVERMRQQGLPISWRDDGLSSQDILSPSVSIGRSPGGSSLTTATLRRTMHATESVDSILKLDLFLQDQAEVTEKIDEYLESIAVVLRQDRQIISEGGDPHSAAARYHTAHPFLIKAMSAWNISAEEVVRPAFTGAGPLLSARSTDGVLTEMIKRDLGEHRVTIVRNLLRRRVIVKSMILRHQSSDAPIMTFDELEGRPLIIMHGVTLPETVLTMITGRPLSTVVDGGPIAALGGFEIVDAWNSTMNSAPSTIIGLAAELEPVAVS